MLEESPAHVLWPSGSCAGKPAEAIEQSVDLIAQLQGIGGRSQFGQGGLALRVKGGGGAQAVEGRLGAIVGAGRAIPWPGG
jgi:hypothetical protein